MTKPIDELALEAWLAFRRRGERAALVTLINIDGSAPRPVGSHIAVSETGEATGYITGGCAEAALAAEAVEAINANENRVRRYGEGSRYMDVQLPCGAGIDLHFAVNLPVDLIENVVRTLKERRICVLDFDLSTECVSFGDSDKAAGMVKGGRIFRRRYEPRTRIEIIGKGPVVPALARIANASGFYVSVATPEIETMKASQAFADRVSSLSRAEDYDVSGLDPWAAAAVLFHEHEWEPPALMALMQSPCFYIGALGSRKTNAARLHSLRALGATDQDLQSINGPIGLDIRAKSPEEIAISILAEIIEARHGANEGRRWRR